VLPDKKVQMFQVQGEPPVDAAPALFSNFLAVSRVATEVQFEFIFMDLNQLAAALIQLKNAEAEQSPIMQGKTVAKLVMPAASFMQLKEQLDAIFSALTEALPKVPEVENELPDRSFR
jgi:hypothetical protein